jgi:hypothetical protein
LLFSVLRMLLLLLPVLSLPPLAVAVLSDPLDESEEGGGAVLDDGVDADSSDLIASCALSSSLPMYPINMCSAAAGSCNRPADNVDSSCNTLSARQTACPPSALLRSSSLGTLRSTNCSFTVYKNRCGGTVAVRLPFKTSGIS